MKKREFYQDTNYFDDHIAFMGESIGKFKQAIKEKKDNPEDFRRLQRAVIMETLHVWIARYSRGDEINILKEEFPQIINELKIYESNGNSFFENFTSYLDGYIKALWLISIATMLKYATTDPVLVDLLEIIGHEGEDLLFEELLRMCGFKRKKADKLLFPVQYKLLYAAMTAETKEDVLKNINQFLKKYYRSMKSCYWHDTHLDDDSGFNGYWCFELGAFISLHPMMDTSSFDDNMFYPKDLVEFMK